MINSIMNWMGYRKTAATYRDSEGWFVDWLTGGKTVSGLSVTNDTALGISTVFACMRNISEDIAKLPLILYQDTPDGGKEKKKDDPLYKILHDSPNSEMSAFSFRQALTAHCIGWGNAYAEIEKDRLGRPIALWPLRPDRVSPKRSGRDIVYEVTLDDSTKVILQAQDVLHIPGYGYDGLVGYNVIRYARESLGLTLAAEKFGSSFFGNGATMSGALEHPGKLSKEAAGRLLKSVEERHQGSDKAHKLMLLEEGMKFNSMSVNPEESQFLATRQFSVAEICRWFRMPPNKVADTTRAQGWSTLEQTNIDYVTDTLIPWAVRWEQAIQLKLISPDDGKDGYFASHLFAGMLRGDTTTRYNAYSIARNGGWMNVNEIREKEDMNPIEGGDEYLKPAPKVENPFGNPATKPVEKQPEEKPVDEKPTASSYRILIEDVADRIVNAEVREIEKHTKLKDKKKQEAPEELADWFDNFYDKHAAYVSGVLGKFAEFYKAQTSKCVNMSEVYNFCVVSSKIAVKGDPAIVKEWEKTKAKELTNLIIQVIDNE